MHVFSKIGGTIRPAMLSALRWTLIAAFTVSTGAVCAFDKLSEAQSLVYDTPHMTNTLAEQVIGYAYLAQVNGGETINDRATVTILQTQDNDKRDVAIDFLSEERHLSLPDFTGYRGNPIIIAMLEHIAQTMGRETGGGALYFRNRIRDALASDAVGIETKKQEINGSQLDTTVVSFSPFVDDEHFKSDPQYANALFSIALSEGAPGGVVAIKVVSEHDGTQHFQREIILE